MAGFVEAIPLARVPAQGFVPVRVQETNILVGRAQGRLFACLDRCPHAAAPLSAGRLTGTELQCSRHGWTFDVSSGASIPGPTAFALTQIPVKSEGDLVLVELPEAP